MGGGGRGGKESERGDRNEKQIDKKLDRDTKILID